MTEKISVIVPVHNGEKWLKRLARCVLKQSFRNIELIFVENYSIDDSLAVLMRIAESDNRVIVIESKARGTSLARKKGVEIASGDYIVFMDQDDKYLHNNALKKMHEIINETNSNICQFSTYTYYGFGIKKKKLYANKRAFFTYNDIVNKEIGSILNSYGGGYFSPSVWSKIYSAEVVKDAVKNVNDSLYYAEDYYLNVCCFLSKKVKMVCVDPSAFYIWDRRLGFSSSKSSGMALIGDYNKVKPLIHDMLKNVGASTEVLYRLHLESLYFMLAFLKDEFNNLPTNDLFQHIEQINSMDYIKLAKRFMNYELPEDYKYEELMFLSSDFSPQEFFERFNGANNKVSFFSRFIK